MYLGRPLVVGDLESFDEQAVQVEASCGHLEVNIELAYSATTHAQVADVNSQFDPRCTQVAHILQAVYFLTNSSS